MALSDESEDHVCEECDEEFDSENELRRHNQEVHGGEEERFGKQARRRRAA